jgi:hypothetical protein
MIQTSGGAREFVAGIRETLNRSADPNLAAHIGWQLDALDVWLAATCTACRGLGILANVNGEMVPVSSWTGAWAERGPDGGLTIINAGEAVRCIDCTPDYRCSGAVKEASAA